MRGALLAIFLGANSFFSVALGQPNDKIDSLQHLLVTANQTDSIKLLLEIGLTYFETEDYPKSLDSYFSCLELAERIDDVLGSADASNSIGRVYYDTEDFEGGLEYFSEALRYYEILQNKEKQGGALNNLALIYYELDSIDLAIDYYNRALAIKEQSDNRLDLAAIYHNLGLVYMRRQKFEEAVSNLILSRDIFVELGYDRHAANTTNNIGRAFFKDGKYSEALRYFKEGLEEARQINSAFLIMDNYKYQSDCYAQMNNYSEAYHYANEHYIMKDSLLDIDKKKELAEIEAKYETDIATQENELLKKENEANAAVIKLQYLIGIGIVIITILSVILAFIYYRGNQTKLKANILLKEQKVEIEEKNAVLSNLNSEVTKQNEEIREQKRKLEELNGIKDKLFSIISHEFRSPLNSLKGTLALLKVGAIGKPELDLISKDLNDKINSSSIFLDNLLNWAKSQMHGIQVKPVVIDLHELVNENMQLLKSMADKKQLKIKNNTQDASKIYADANMLNLIFRNLISNAIKFSMHGGIIEIQSELDGDLICISIVDQGIGMTPENVRMLFQVQSFTTRGTANERGTGLGLYISKNFVESNGGHMWVQSEVGKGSVFNFTVPKYSGQESPVS